jgi:hypothetical protein
MDVFAAALATVVSEIDPSAWTRKGRLRIPPEPITIPQSGDFESEDEIDLAEIDISDPDVALTWPSRWPSIPSATRLSTS